MLAKRRRQALRHSMVMPPVVPYVTISFKSERYDLPVRTITGRSPSKLPMQMSAMPSDLSTLSNRELSERLKALQEKR